MTTRYPLARIGLLTLVLSPVVGLLLGDAFWQTGHAQRPGRAGAGFLAGLMNGQSIGLKDENGGYALTIVPGADQGYQIREVGDDYLVLADRTGIRETRIPVYSIKSITTVQAPR